jgi:apolipoprotein D and lipocalin family protein
LKVVDQAFAFAHRHRVVRTAIGHARPRVAPRWAAAVALVAATTLQPAAVPAQTPPPVRAVPFVDLDRYAGDWFEIARFPNGFQRQCVGDVRATYARRPDGRVDVVNLAPDYSWAVVGDPDRDYLWILARAPHLDDASTAVARAAARDNGFDLKRLVPTSQAGALGHDAEGRKDRVPNRQHPVGEIPHQTVAALAAAMAHAASPVVHSRSGAVCLLQPDSPSTSSW